MRLNLQNWCLFKMIISEVCLKTRLLFLCMGHMICMYSLRVQWANPCAVLFAIRFFSTKVFPQVSEQVRVWIFKFFFEFIFRIIDHYAIIH